MTVLECPICAHEMGESESLEGACPVCGFAYPYVRMFVSTTSCHRWHELVDAYRTARVSDARSRLLKGRLLQASNTAVYLLDDRTHVLSCGSSWNFSPVKEGVMRFSVSGRDLVAVMADGSLWSQSGTWKGTAGASYRDVELTNRCLYALRSDGSVEVRGECAFRDDVEGLRDVEELAADVYHVAARLSDGSVRFAASGRALEDFQRPCAWRGIVSLASSAACTAGVDGEGHVHLAVREGDGREAARRWEGIVGVVAEGPYVVGVDRAGGVHLERAPVVADRGRSDAAEWKDVVALACSSSSIIGVLADGTLRVAGPMPQSGDVVRSWNASVVRRMLFSAV